ncbi:MAG: SUMF1/EgtB/PvdO family nonheme iron enzyme, partial [Verrucomicrobiota bacterium]
HSSQQDLKLPDNRAELFHDLIDLLLTRWAERPRRTETGLVAGAGETLGELLQDPGVAGFELDHLLQLVAELAHDHYRGGRERSLILIPAETLRRRLVEQHHDPDTALGAAWAERVMTFIQFRAGLLNSPDGGENYDFPHSLLGEYLAAYHLARQRRSSEVVTNKVTADGNWDEIVRLAAGHHIFVRKETRDALDLAEELCQAAKDKPAETVTDLEWRRVALAGDILHEMGQQRLERERRQGPACRELLRGLLQCLLVHGALPARDRARAGVVLGHLGDPRPCVGLKHGMPNIDWIEIPPGPFKMGSQEGEGSSDERPQFDCDVITQPFAISRYPVTVAQYQAFVDAGGYGEKQFWTDAGWEWRQSDKVSGPEDNEPVYQTPNHPRAGVSWFEALAFCRWLAERTKLNVTLPSEAEWERAARHTDGRAYPWGDEEQGIEQRCNMDKTGLGHTSAVGIFPTGLAKCGAADMAGNVWEWTRSLWGKDYKREFPYPYSIDGKREDLDAARNVARVLRGGSWDVSAGSARCASRSSGSFPTTGTGASGFGWWRPHSLLRTLIPLNSEALTHCSLGGSGAKPPTFFC